MQGLANTIQQSCQGVLRLTLALGDRTHGLASIIPRCDQLPLTLRQSCQTRFQSRELPIILRICKLIRHELSGFIVQNQSGTILTGAPRHDFKPRQGQGPRQKRAARIIAMQLPADLHIDLLQDIRRPLLPCHQGQDKSIKRTLRRCEMPQKFRGQSVGVVRHSLT